MNILLMQKNLLNLKNISIQTLEIIIKIKLQKNIIKKIKIIQTIIIMVKEKKKKIIMIKIMYIY